MTTNAAKSVNPGHCAFVVMMLVCITLLSLTSSYYKNQYEKMQEIVKPYRENLPDDVQSLKLIIGLQQEQLMQQNKNMKDLLINQNILEQRLRSLEDSQKATKKVQPKKTKITTT
jgi:hypothetical protein